LIWEFFCFFLFKEEERRKREDLERILVENDRKLAEAEKRIVSSDFEVLLFLMNFYLG
jgi:lipase chaperone LimK